MEPEPKYNLASDFEQNSSRTGSILPENREENDAVSQHKHPREGWAAWRWPCVQLAFILGGILLGYDISNVANIQPPIYKAFGQVHLLPWVATGYAAAQVCMVPLVRKLAALGNVKLQIVLYILIFIIGAAVSGSASGINSLIIGRAVSGIGGSGIYQLCIFINVLFTTPNELPRLQGLIAAAWAVGLTLGPVVGGAFAENPHATWRWAMYLNLPILAVVVILLSVALPNIRLADEAPIIAGLLAIDWTGVVLHIVGFILLCSSLIFSGSTWAWSSNSAIVAWVFVGVIYAVYVLQQYFCLFTNEEHRNIPADLLKSRTIALVGMATCAAGSCYGVALYYTPLFFAFTKGLEPVAAAVRLLPFIFTFIVFTIVTAGLIPVIGRYAPFYVSGGALAIIGAGLQAQLTAQTSEARIMGVSTLMGAGTGCMWQTGVAVMAQSVPANRRFDATALFIMLQLSGISITLSLAGCIFQNLGFNRLQGSLAGLGYSEHDIREALAGLDSKIWADADPRVVAIAVQDVASVIADMHYVVIASGAVSFACGCLMKWEKLTFGKVKAAN